ncbi:MAG: peptidoglycan-binding protein [Cyanobacteria bacterium P01_D01_bin.128]
MPLPKGATVLIGLLPLLFGIPSAIAQQSLVTAAPVTAAPVTAAPVTAAAPQRLTRPTLRLGSEGTSVTELQAMLKLLGYYTGAVDGLYQASTQTAVTQFQQAAGLSADGIAGPATWNRLLPEPPAATVPPSETPPAATADPANPTNPSDTSSPEPAPSDPTQNASEDPNGPISLPVLRQGLFGPAIVRLQERLRALDFYQGPIDGIFGPGTEAAVQRAQRRFQLTDDGIVGPATWSALLR